MRQRSCTIGLGVAAALQMAAAALAESPCKLAAMGTAQVAAVRDGRTLALSDGRELRLAAIEAGEEGRAALQALAEGASLRLERLGAAQDRYGRVVAFAFAGDTTQSLQEVLLEQGQARVSARVGGKACADGLLRLEREARAARRGLWADPNFAPLAAENLPRLRAEGGRFVLVEGKVLSVRESGATVYFNFGRRWTRDFSVILLRRHKPAFTAAGLDPKALEGRRIRVRGWLEQRAGPVIEASAPEQIEFIE
jgi:endonuclease YncB( thermonuclease family)